MWIESAKLNSLGQLPHRREGSAANLGLQTLEFMHKRDRNGSYTIWTGKMAALQTRCVVHAVAFLQVMNRNLREEQDAAYQRSLQEDRDREERREKEHQAEETKRRQAEEAAQQER